MPLNPVKPNAAKYENPDEPRQRDELEIVIEGGGAPLWMATPSSHPDSNRSQ